MRAKLRLDTVTPLGAGEILKFNAVCGGKVSNGYPDDGADEDNTYARFSPSASLEIHVNNPALKGKFQPGEKYYVDFTPADQSAEDPA